jgi:hypothetical protein
MRKGNATLLYLALDIGLSAKSGLLIQYVEVALVEKQTASSFSTRPPQDACFDQAIHGSGSSWELRRLETPVMAIMRSPRKPQRVN